MNDDIRPEDIVEEQISMEPQTEQLPEKKKEEVIRNNMPGGLLLGMIIGMAFGQMLGFNNGMGFIGATVGMIIEMIIKKKRK